MREHFDGRFTTAVYAFLDVEEHLLRYSLAGHALLAHLRRWSGMGVDGHFDDDLTIVVIDFDPDTMSATFRTWAA